MKWILVLPKEASNWGKKGARYVQQHAKLYLGECAEFVRTHNWVKIRIRFGLFHYTIDRWQSERPFGHIFCLYNRQMSYAVN